MARVRVPEPEKDRSERWLLTYADMITLLLALFVVLFASSKVDLTRFEQIASAIQRAFNVPVLQGASSSSILPSGSIGNTFAGLTGVGAAIGPELLAFAQREQAGDQVSLTASREAVVITLSGGLPFGSGSAELREPARQLLQIIATTVRDHPERPLIRVEGHTDSQPTAGGPYATNWDLSSARAGAAARVLEEFGISKDRLIAIGYADTQPVGDNATPEGRAQNRRVVISIVTPEPLGPRAATPAPVAAR